MSVNTYDKQLGTQEKEKFLFVRGGSDRVVWQVRMCLLHKAASSRSRMCTRVSARIFVIYSHTWNAQPFLPSFTRPRTTYMTERSKVKEEKRWNVIFIYETFPPTHTTELTQRTDGERVHADERERHKSISHFPPHSINIWMYMLLFYVHAVILYYCCVCPAFPTHTRAQRKQQQQRKVKKIKHTKNNKRNISRAFCYFFSFFISCRPTNANVEKYMCVYRLLAVYCFFPFRFRRCFILVRGRESKDTSVSFFVSKCTVRLCLVLSVVFNGLKISYISDRVDD